VLKYKEEPSLEARFGVEYLEYKENIPFLLPNISKMFKDLLKFKK
jgi:protein-S-isoprenylcysteine O-methyltransferase Ste14